MIIYIDIENNFNVLSFLISELEEMNGWKVDSNALIGNRFWKKMPNKTARFFEIDMQWKILSWWGTECEKSTRKITTMDAAKQFLREL